MEGKKKKKERRRRIMPSLVANTSALARKRCVRTHYVRTNNAMFSGHYGCHCTHNVNAHRVNNKEFLHQENGSVLIYLSGSLISKTRTEWFQCLYLLNQHVEVSVVPWTKNHSGNMTPLLFKTEYRIVKNWCERSARADVVATKLGIILFLFPSTYFSPRRGFPRKLKFGG